MVYIKNSGWVVVFADHRVEKEVSALAKDVRANFERIVDLIEVYGLENMHEPQVKHIKGKIWEMRAKGRDGIARALYVTAVGKKVIVLHAFVKKTQKAPDEAINLAIKRGKELGFL
jgi:phage-related protein